MARLYLAYLKLESKAAGRKESNWRKKRSSGTLDFPWGITSWVVFCWITEETDQSIGELQEACACCLTSLSSILLSQAAYTRAKRKEEAERARQTFLRLSQQAEQVRGGGLGVDERRYQLPIRLSDGTALPR